MTIRRPYERARRLARDVLRECGADEPSKIDPFAIVGRREVAVRYGKLEGATARIFHLDGRAVIRISDGIVQRGRLLFSVAHEMGHLLLGHKLPSEAELDPTGEAFYSPRQEREADAFAAEHNMPEEWVQSQYCDAQPGLDAVRAIMRTFPASIVASALRYVELASVPCAVAYTERRVVMWARCNGRFPARIPTHLKIGAGSIAFDYHEREIVDPDVRRVPARAWFGSASRVDDSAQLFEHAELIPEPGWGGVLSLLWFGQTAS